MPGGERRLSPPDDPARRVGPPCGPAELRTDLPTEVARARGGYTRAEAGDGGGRRGPFDRVIAWAASPAVACVYAAVEWARPRAAVARIAVTGPHPALGSLLAAGFRFGEVETLCATDDVSFVDVRRYISSGGDLF